MNTTLMTPSQKFAQAAATEEFAMDHAKMEFTEEMLQLMDERGINRVQLAEKLGVKPSRITALLRGVQNFTFETAVRVARALNADFVPKLRPKEQEYRWELYHVDSVHSAFICGGQPIAWGNHLKQTASICAKNEFSPAA
jgi:hypothetical protein